MIPSTALANTRLNAFNAIKASTSLEIKNQKILSNLQSKQTDTFLKFAKADLIYDFLISHKFLICFRFIDSPNFKYQDLNARFRLSSASVLRVDDYDACQQLIHKYTISAEWLAELLSTGAVYLLGVNDETRYLEVLKKGIALESDAAQTAMFALLFSKEESNWITLLAHDSKSLAARELYKTWDSKESVLIELTNTLSSIAYQLTCTMQNEIVSGTDLSLPYITIIPRLN